MSPKPPTPAAKKRRPAAAPAPPPSKVRAEARARARAEAAAPAVPAGRDWPTIMVGAAVSLVALILYLLTAARDVIAGDTVDFLIASKTLGVAHAPGYPLLTFLGYLFSWLPVGSTAFRIGLLAVVCSTATVAVVYATAWRLTSRLAPAAAAGLALACTPLFWRWSLQMETFPLNNLLIALVVYLLVRWHQDPTRRNVLFGAAVVFGLALTNQETAALLIPAIGWLLWLHRRQLRREGRTVGYAAILLAAAALLPYLYVPLAAQGHAPANWDDVHSLSAFLRLAFRGDYGGLTAQGGAAARGGNVALRTLFLGRGFGLVVGIFAALGLIEAYRRARWYFWFVVLGVAVTGIGFMLSTNLDPSNSIDLFVLQRFFLLPLVLAAPLVGLGVAGVGRVITDRRPSIDLRRSTVGAALVVVVASGVVVGLNYSTLDVSHDHVAGNYARDVVEGLKPHTILFATGDEADITTLYMTTVAGIRPDVTVVLSPLLGFPWYAQVLRHNHQINLPATVTTRRIIGANPNRPVAFIGPAPDTSLNRGYYFYPVGLVNDLEKKATTILITRDEADNKAQLARVHVPSWRAIKPDSFEQAILDHYAAIPLRIGQAYRQGGQTSEAMVWFRRALAMDPSLTAAATAIEKLGGTP